MSTTRFIFAAMLLTVSAAFSAEPAPEPKAEAKAEPVAGKETSAAPEPGKKDASAEKTGNAPADKTAVSTAKPAGPMPKLPLKSEWFDQIADMQPDDKQMGDEDDAQKLEFHALEDILLALKACSEDYLQKNVSETSYRQLMKEAEKFRGHVVQFRGLLEFSERFPIPDNKSETSLLWRGQISNITGQIFTFFTLEQPSAELLKHPVRITGIFMKRYAYKNRLAGEKLTWTPAIFVKSIEPYSEADVASGSSPMSTITGLAIAAMILFLVVRIGYRYSGIKAKSAKGNPFTRMKREREGPPRNFPKPQSKG